jgi:uncharacterized protein
MATLAQIEQFVAQRHIAVAGISRNPHKFGNAVFKELLKQGYNVYPISKYLQEFEGIRCFPDIASLPSEVSAIVISTKPEQTIELVKEAEAKEIRHIWLQQGAANSETLALIKNSNANIISKQCILMFAKPEHFIHKTHILFKKLFGTYPN